MSKKTASARPDYLSAYESHGPDPDDFEPADVAVFVHEVRREVLSDEASEDLRQQALEIALGTMTEAEWEARRLASGDPVLADVEMIFGDKGQRH